MTKLPPLLNQQPPAFIGIGAMRCGTTWIAQRLREHPEIHIPADFKEIHYFDQFYKQGMEWYLANFSKTQPDQICGEFTPSYLRTESVRERIKQDLPQTKLIVSLREPAARAHSHHNFLQIRTDISPSFLEAIMDERYDILKAGLYGEQLSKWFHSFPPEQIHIILFDDIRDHPAKTISELYHFLGVDHEFLPPGLTHQENVRHGVHSLRLAGLMRGIRHLIRPHLISRQRLKRLGLFKLGKWINHVNSTPASATSQDNSGESFLQAYYQQDIELLESILGKDLSTWK